MRIKVDLTQDEYEEIGLTIGDIEDQVCDSVWLRFNQDIEVQVDANVED